VTTSGERNPIVVNPIVGNTTVVEPVTARVIAAIIGETFDEFHAMFRELTARAQGRFERMEWQEGRDDSVERLQLYRRSVALAVSRLRDELGGASTRRDSWLRAKSVYARFAAGRDDFEIAETFFNSVTRQVFTTVGVDDNLEFVWFGATSLPRGADNRALFDAHVAPRSPEERASTAEMMRSILTAYAFAVDYADLDRDVALIAERLDDRLREVWDTPWLDRVDMLRPVFYRNKGAYLIGRVQCRNRVIPLIMPLLRTPEGIVVDTVLLSETEASRIFSFTRSYFHVSWHNPAELVGFLKSLVPVKPIAELFNTIGYPSHGKTMLFRALYRHLRNSTDKFQVAPGVKGMVMTVFTLPSYDVVFKIIKDRFAPPKRTTREQVMAKYKLVQLHDRVGRMVDAQEFERLTFPRERFAPELLAELLAEAASSVRVTADEVVIRHLYAERRLYPLDLYLRETPPDRARNAVLEYGRAVKELAAANIFPGDLFTKNFGVTRHGNVVFYDYDELCLLTDCRFRDLPSSSTYEEELSDQPWFSVSTDDVFPEEWRRFLWLPKELRADFEREHGDLFSAAYWRELQARVAHGEVLDVFPYAPELRFPPRACTP
jgi:isocitrate dehydrogenase kinase/phosphatase